MKLAELSTESSNKHKYMPYLLWDIVLWDIAHGVAQAVPVPLSRMALGLIRWNLV
jgi:hypothetical protein